MLFNLKNELNGFPGKLPPFNPLLFPGNIAIYDGDVNCSSANWRDTTGGNQITFFNAPTYNAAGLNGHGTVLFNSTTQYGNCALTCTYPFTIYFVLKSTSWTNGDFILDETIGNYQIYQIGVTPRIRVGNSGGDINNNQLTLNTWSILTVILNSSNSGIRINLNSIVNGTLDNLDITGFNLAVDTGLSAFCDLGIAYIIFRNVIDSTPIQNNIINWLKNRFAI